MILSPTFQRFVEKSPISVMAYIMVERVMNPEKMNEWFNMTAQRQYTRELMFSSVFDIMSFVVHGSYPSVRAAYEASKEEIGVSLTSLYNKLNGIEVTTSAELVRYAANEIKPIIEGLGGMQSPILPGYRVKILDGNCIEASEHRIKELRSIAAGALPGKSLVVYDPALRLPIDVFPCEDGHAQERSLLKDVLKTVSKKDVWIGDRNFCVVSFICGIHERNAFFIIREHKNLPKRLIGKEKKIGLIETGSVFEQSIIVTDELGKEHKFRRIRVLLNKETRDGDKEIFLITDLPKKEANAKMNAIIYRDRWKIETSFQELEKYFNSEINTLGYPGAALFAFCVALISYMMLSVIKAALACEHGTEKIEKELSGYYVADEISATYRGMMIAIPKDEWEVFRELSQSELIVMLKQLSANVKMSRFKKTIRGPKKKQPKRKSDPKVPHVSTAKILAERKK